MNIEWNRIREDAKTGYRIFRAEIETIVNKTLGGAEGLKKSQHAAVLDQALQKAYQELGEKFFDLYIKTERKLPVFPEFNFYLKKIEELLEEKRRIMPENEDAV